MHLRHGSQTRVSRRRTAALFAVPAVLVVVVQGHAETAPRASPRLDAAVPSGSTSPLPPPDAAGTPPGMLRVEGGTFEMGASPADRRAERNERPRHDVVVSAFFLDQTEVTVDAYRACVARGACASPVSSSTACTFHQGNPRAAMSCVSYAEADRFCVAHGKRLPTEAEWEWAAQPPKAPTSARASDDADPVFPWGTDDFDCTHAGSTRFRACDGGREVGLHPLGRSRAGIDDLGANLQEWVADAYSDDYTRAIAMASPSRDAPRSVGASVSAPGGVAHVLRGGHYRSRGASDLRITARSWGSMTERGPTTGFRCASDASAPKLRQPDSTPTKSTKPNEPK